MDPETTTTGPEEPEKEGAALEVSKVDMEFTIFTENGKEKFACQQCEYRADKVGSVKRHISAKHGIARGSGMGRKRKSMDSKKLESNAK